MKIIINTTNLKGGGALQVAISFVYECIHFIENDYYIFLSPSMAKEIDTDKFPKNMKFYTFKNPSRFILFDKTIQSLKDTESQIKPDCVFSVFGPTYWQPKSKHVMGFANGLYLYGDLPYIKNMPFLEKIKFNMKKFYHRFLLKNNADLYITQTEDMKNRFSKFIKVPKEKIFVVSGKYHTIFEKKVEDLKLLPIKKEGEFWFVTISAFYPHKKLDVINDLVEIIRKNNLNIKFVLTLPDTIIEKVFKNAKDIIINIGPVKLEECPYVYSRADALFLPTLVESFTSSYPEAMRMKKPILTSNYPFSTLVCKDSALYFDPYNIDDIMKQIIAIYSNRDLYDSMITKGTEIVETLPSSKERAEKYLRLCEKVIVNV